MTKEEAMLIPELNIEVTEMVEDAFYGFRDIDDAELEKRLSEMPDDYESGDIETDRLMEKYMKDIEISERARERWFACQDPKERMDAVLNAFQMIENIKKYGVPCVAWM